MQRVYLLRHARPLPPAENESDPPLSAQGAADAQVLVEPLSALGISRVVSSPLRRARQTVEPFAASSGIPLEMDARLREREMPLASGPKEHIDRVRRSFEDWDYAPPGGESFRETVRRALQCLRDHARQTSSGLLLVGHGQCLTLILRNFDDRADLDFWVELPTPAIIELTIQDIDGPGTFRHVPDSLRQCEGPPVG